MLRIPQEISILNLMFFILLSNSEIALRPMLSVVELCNHKSSAPKMSLLSNMEDRS
jgi:hypothetical protein